MYRQEMHLFAAHVIKAGTSLVPLPCLASWLIPNPRIRAHQTSQHSRRCCRPDHIDVAPQCICHRATPVIYVETTSRFGAALPCVDCRHRLLTREMFRVELRGLHRLRSVAPYGTTLFAEKRGIWRSSLRCCFLVGVRLTL